MEKNIVINQLSQNRSSLMMRLILLVTLLCLTYNTVMAEYLTLVTVTTTPTTAVSIGKPITLTATAIGGVDVQYKFMNGAVMLRDFASSNTYTFTPGYAKSYSFTAIARDVNGIVSPTVTITVNPALSAVSLVTSLASPVVAGKVVVLTATPTGGTSVLYKFMSGTDVIRDFSSSNSFVWTPSIVKTHELTVIAKDSMGVDQNATVTSVIKPFVVSPALSSVALNTTPNTYLLFGKPVTLTTVNTGGLNVQYKFMAGTVVLQDFSSINTCTFTPSYIKTYSLTVIAKDLSGVDATATVTSTAVSLTTKAALSSVTLSTSPLTTARYGTPIKLTAVATGGISLQYKFMYGTVILNDFSNNNSYTFTPGFMKLYSFTVVVRDIDGTTLTSAPVTVLVTAPLPPTITGFTPTTVVIGDVVTISGTNLSGASVVKFNNIASLNITNITATSLMAVVPVGATAGKISVTTLGGTALSTNDFSVYQLPTITSFTPHTGLTGASVTITGTNYIGATAVKFNGISATNFTVNNSISINATIPAGISTGKISVTTPGGTAISADNFTPSLSAVVLTTNPLNSAAFGTPVTLTATATGGESIQYRFMYGALMLRDFSSLNCYTFTPAAVKTYSNLTVIAKDINPVPNISITSASVSFVVTPPPPTISSFTPTSALVGTVVTITGTNLLGTSAVKFNGVAATTITNITATSLKATVPVDATTGLISVTTANGTVNSIDEFILNYNVGDVKINPIDGATMVWVPGGTFTMGSIDGVGFGSEQPAHQVTLSGYWINKYEVTVAQYRAFCTATSRALPSFPSGYSWTGKTGWTDAALQQHPIVNVSWNDCVAYANWAGVTLPTEAQWEYAARGPQGRNYPWGGTATSSDNYNGWDQTKCANYYNSCNVGKSTWPVGSFPAGVSWCGAQDMAGNAWEWCNDWYGSYSSTVVTNPTGPALGTYRVLRGGSWYNVLNRGAYRYDSYPGINFINGIGFRCAVSSPGP